MKKPPGEILRSGFNMVNIAPTSAGQTVMFKIICSNINHATNLSQFF